MLKKRVVQVTNNVTQTYSQEDITIARVAARMARRNGDNETAQNAERYATMIENMLNGGRYYYSGQ